MFYTELLTKPELVLFLRKSGVKVDGKESRKNMDKKAKYLLEKRKTELKKSYGQRMKECISPSGNTSIVTQKKLSQHHKNLCTRTQVTETKKKGCTYGAKRGQQCVPCSIDKNGRFPKECKGCPAGSNIFYCS